MAVFTHVTEPELSAFLDGYALGSLVSFEGIAQGVDNTNYKITTTRGRYVLTLFESRIRVEDIPFFLGFTAHLAANDIACPGPMTDRRGETLRVLCGKPAALFPFLEGAPTDKADITPALCAQLGTLLARMHSAGAGFPMSQSNSMGFDAWEVRLKKTGDQGFPFLEKLQALRQKWPSDLPVGAVHLDLFPDNVFSLDGHICAVIDFYFSGTDFLAYDLAIVLNAWCFDRNGAFVEDRWAALRDAYQAIRPLTQEEKLAFPVLLQGAAMRFLASRLHDLVFHDPKALVTPHDPQEYMDRLAFHETRKEAFF